jgi:hypothetical protein
MLSTSQRRHVQEIAKRMERGEELFPRWWVRERGLSQDDVDWLRYYMAAMIVGWCKMDTRTQARILKLGAEAIYGPLKERE